MTSTRRLILTAILAALPLTHADAQERRRGPPQSEQRGPAEQRGQNEQRSGPGVLSLLPADDVVTDHTLSLGERTLAYTATAGTFSLFDGNGERSAAIFYTAYVAKDVGGAVRPLTFVFNGGPGAASVYLQLGLAGPRAIEFGDKPDGIAPRVADNPETWLAFTDLVFVDPVGTGWSRPAKPDGGKDFWSVNSDASSIAKVMALYTAKNSRAASPIYLLGESYGGYRALKVARAVQREQGLVVAGIVMVSPFLDGTLSGGRQNALSAALSLPSLAAAELDRRAAYTPAALAEAERFAMTDYLTTLAGAVTQGEAAAAFYARVAKLTGVSLDIVTRQRGFIGGSFAKQTVDGRAAVASSYDAAFTSPDPYPDLVSAEGSDPVLDGYTRALGGAFVGYARETLGFKTDMTFNVLNGEIAGKWDWNGGRGRANGERDIRELLGLNRSLRILVAHGRSDMVTPYGVSRYVLDHIPPIGAPGRLALKTYKGGHMFYYAASERRAFTDDAAGFYKGRVGE